MPERKEHKTNVSKCKLMASQNTGDDDRFGVVVVVIPSVRSFAGRPDDDDDEEHDGDGAHDDDHLDILPPVLAFESRRRALELRRAFLQRVRTIVQLRQLLIAFQDLLDVHLQA